MNNLDLTYKVITLVDSPESTEVLCKKIQRSMYVMIGLIFSMQSFRLAGKNSTNIFCLKYSHDAQDSFNPQHFYYWEISVFRTRAY